MNKKVSYFPIQCISFLSFCQSVNPISFLSCIPVSFEFSCVWNLKLIFLSIVCQIEKKRLAIIFFLAKFIPENIIYYIVSLVTLTCYSWIRPKTSWIRPEYVLKRVRENCVCHFLCLWNCVGSCQLFFTRKKKVQVSSWWCFVGVLHLI